MTGFEQRNQTPGGNQAPGESRLELAVRRAATVRHRPRHLRPTPTARSRPRWTARRRAFVYWLVVELAAVAAVAHIVRTQPVPTPTDVSRFAAIAITTSLVLIGTALALEARPHEQYRDPWAIHCCYLIAGVFTLPVNLLVLLMLGPALHGVLGGRSTPSRWMSVTAATALAALAARLAAGWEQPQWSVPAYLLACSAMLLGRTFLVTLGAVFNDTRWTPRGRFANWTDIMLAVVAVNLGGLLAIAIRDSPLLALLAVAPMALLEIAGQIPRLRRSAQTDPKTGLANAGYWERLAREELRRDHSKQQPAALLLLDLDHFKRVNDRMGHLAGDAALAAVALMLRHNVRRADLVGRFGGEEFVILLPDTLPDAAHHVAQRIREAVAALNIPVIAQGGEPAELSDLTVSIGVAVTARHGYELSPLLAIADTALLSAKGAGRNQVIMA